MKAAVAIGSDRPPDFGAACACAYAAANGISMIAEDRDLSHELRACKT